MNETLRQIIDSIQPLPDAPPETVLTHLDDLTKPPGSLGRLEEFAARFCLIRGTDAPEMPKKAIFTFAADHGVTEAGVSAYPKEVTRQMVLNMASGGAAINVLARHADAECRVVDVGVDADFGPVPGVVHRKVRRGTANLAIGPAMSPTEAEAAIGVGASLALEAANDGFSLLGTGEMGIGNTTPSAALFAALLPADPERVTGRGTGIDDGRLRAKIDVIRLGLNNNRNRLGDPLLALAAVGGLEIAAICGLILAAASRRIPVIVDGFISSAAALVAFRLQPNARAYLFFSHLSHEAGHRIFLDAIGARPMLDLDLRLGEGTGAALAMTLIDAGIRIYREMNTFSGAGVSRTRAATP
ncbi:MAG TPA: nicotinate-nucleotide--dimethylbenzimidazole phosphoribosyltransferase [Verrucomicrobiae bacterium]|nr:nicotinate-nucleotide--dimethylbenzimidazole phosphoribosyltransferase [Verrucomicrobiae bacterium]